MDPLRIDVGEGQRRMSKGSLVESAERKEYEKNHLQNARMTLVETDEDAVSFLD